jgi:hypothetical protein
MLLRAILIGMAVSFSSQAQEKSAKKPTPQQERMAECNKKASGMKGDERKAFMSKCLSDTPQDRMAKCNKDASAKGMKGDERKKFMSECLKG